MVRAAGRMSHKWTFLLARCREPDRRRNMFMNDSEAAEELQRLTRELENFQDIAQQLVPLPGEVPTLEGFDIWGGSLQVSGSVGGDHITYVDFKKRFDLTARIDRARAEGRLDVVENLERWQHKGGVALI